MSEGTPTTDAPASPAHEGTSANGPHSPELTLPEAPRPREATLEELSSRVRRLEEQYAALQDTKLLEERVAQRVITRVRRKPAANSRATEVVVPDVALPEPAAVPPSVPDPPAVSALALPEESLPTARPVPVDMAATAIAPVATVIIPSAPEGPVAVPTVTAVSAQPLPPPSPGVRVSWLWRSWLALDILNELRVMLRMLVDPRYRLTWPGRIVPVVVLVLIVLSDTEKLAFLFPWNLVAIFGYYVNKLFQILLLFIMFKVLLREVDRYRDQVPDAPRPLKP
jgi:hypothetical protein